MLARFSLVLFLAGATVCGDVKTKVYETPSACVKTYHVATGKVLTRSGVVEDPTVNSLIKSAVSAQMQRLNIAEADKNPDIEVRFIGGNSAGLQVYDPRVGDIAMWDIGAPVAVQGHTYKKTTLVMAVVETHTNRTLWAAQCSDRFGDPARMQERIDKAVQKAFAKFPEKVACGS